MEHLFKLLAEELAPNSAEHSMTKIFIIYTDMEELVSERQEGLHSLVIWTTERLISSEWSFPDPQFLTTLK